jgi:hypothetical protein
MSLKDGLQLLGVHPVIGGASILFLGGADKSAILYAGNVAGIRAGKIATRTLLGIELNKSAALHHFLAEGIVLLLATVTPVHGVGSAELGNLLDPFDKFLILGWKIGHFREFRAFVRPLSFR